MVAALMATMLTQEAVPISSPSFLVLVSSVFKLGIKASLPYYKLMTEIIPSINARTFEEVKDLVKKVEPYVKWCHLDVTDGIFSKHLTWHNPSDLPALATKLNAEVHLMVSEPEKIIDHWLIKPIKRVIVHLEVSKDLDLVIKKCREAGVEIGLAINPETFWGLLTPWFGKVDMVQTLAVHPGPSGQEVDWPEMLGKIRHIREGCPGCTIELDGGVNPESALIAAEAGADILVAGAYIFNSSNKEKAIEELYAASGR